MRSKLPQNRARRLAKLRLVCAAALALAFWGPLHHTPHTHTHSRYICNFIGNTRDAAADKDRATYVKQSSEVSLPLPLSLCPLFVSVLKCYQENCQHAYNICAPTIYYIPSSLSPLLPTLPLLCLSVAPPVVNPQLTKVLT